MSLKYKGFTLIELVMVLAIIGVLAGVGAHLMSYSIQNYVLIPNQLNADMIAQDAINTMIEGDAQAKGLRFSRKITGGFWNDITFINQDGQSVTYRLDTDTNKLYRSIDGSPEVLLPYYLSNGVSITGKNGQLFTLYNSNEEATYIWNNVRRVEIGLIAWTGSGLYADWEGSSEQISSIAIKRFQ